jgi:hypothetical protein
MRKTNFVKFLKTSVCLSEISNEKSLHSLHACLLQINKKFEESLNPEDIDAQLGFELILWPVSGASDASDASDA